MTEHWWGRGSVEVFSALKGLCLFLAYSAEECVAWCIFRVGLLYILFYPLL